MTSRSTIIRLLLSGGPATVRRRIAQIVVLSIQRMLRAWTLADVPQELGEGVLPASADFDSPASITGPPFIFGVCAAGFHRNPDSVFRDRLDSLQLPASRAMLQCPATFSFEFSEKAAAALDSPNLQITRIHNRVTTAHAYTLPSGPPLSDICSAPENSETTEHFADEIPERRFFSDQRITVPLPAVIVHGAEPMSVAPALATRYCTARFGMSRSHSLVNYT